MPDDTKQKGQQPERQQPQGNGSQPIDAYTDPVAYLIARKWLPVGITSHATCRWLDPTKPSKEEWKSVPIVAADSNGDIRPVMVDDGFGRKAPGMRKVCTPAREPVTMQEALLSQLARDDEQLAKAS
jgi:hypothetical protein